MGSGLWFVIAAVVFLAVALTWALSVYLERADEKRPISTRSPVPLPVRGARPRWHPLDTGPEEPGGRSEGGDRSRR